MDVSEELRKLKEIYDLGFVRDEEYERRRNEIYERAGMASPTDSESTVIVTQSDTMQNPTHVLYTEDQPPQLHWPDSSSVSNSQDHGHVIMPVHGKNFRPEDVQKEQSYRDLDAAHWDKSESIQEDVHQLKRIPPSPSNDPLRLYKYFSPRLLLQQSAPIPRQEILRPRVFQIDFWQTLSTDARGSSEDETPRLRMKLKGLEEYPLIQLRYRIASAQAASMPTFMGLTLHEQNWIKNLKKYREYAAIVCSEDHVCQQILQSMGQSSFPVPDLSNPIRHDEENRWPEKFEYVPFDEVMQKKHPMVSDTDV
eukprot:TRINITY_DN8678_c0_g1_i1.p1 TRINITY_DN8678_c0_g1~~TRINITY_DN8678_c0_g1_i1.p1  ORF type:complete len:309 (+),score=55.62 TRINITY_DN8678_c0_g1_i1:38-964(+)